MVQYIKTILTISSSLTSLTKTHLFEYADGVNDVKINDAFISDFDAVELTLTSSMKR